MNCILTRGKKRSASVEAGLTENPFEFFKQLDSGQRSLLRQGLCAAFPHVKPPRGRNLESLVFHCQKLGFSNIFEVFRGLHQNNPFYFSQEWDVSKIHYLWRESGVNLSAYYSPQQLARFFARVPLLNLKDNDILLICEQEQDHIDWPFDRTVVSHIWCKNPVEPWRPLKKVIAFVDNRFVKFLDRDEHGFREFVHTRTNFQSMSLDLTDYGDKYAFPSFFHSKQHNKEAYMFQLENDFQLQTRVDQKLFDQSTSAVLQIFDQVQPEFHKDLFTIIFDYLKPSQLNAFPSAENLTFKP